MSAVNSQVRTSTAVRSSEGPFLRVMVTGPWASDHFRVMGTPASGLKPLFEKSNWMAWAAAARAARMRAVDDCILAVRKRSGIKYNGSVRRRRMDNECQERFVELVR